MLLESRKVAPLERLYAAYGRRLLRRSFARVRIGGEPWPAEPGPSVAYLNHSAWWDPILVLYLSHDLFRRDGFGIMQGAQLERFPFFRRIGCFGTTGETLDDVRSLSAYAASLLRSGVRRTLWIFPQGELVPATAPLVLRSGLARLARAVPDAPVVPAAVRYVFRAEQRPEIFVRIGPATRVARGESPFHLTRRLEQGLRQELAALDADLARPGEPHGYRATLEGRGSLSAFYERTIGRLPKGVGRATGG